MAPRHFEFDPVTVKAADAIRFMSKVEKTTSCWKWRGAKIATGYGVFWFMGRNMKAHRASYLLHRGSFDPRLVIRHTCDNRECVNPEHLLPGTNAENNRDRDERYRGFAHYMVLDGIRASIRAHARRKGLLSGTVAARLKRGMSIEDALTQPSPRAKYA